VKRAGEMRIEARRDLARRCRKPAIPGRVDWPTELSSTETSFQGCGITNLIAEPQIVLQVLELFGFGTKTEES